MKGIIKFKQPIDNILYKIQQGIWSAEDNKVTIVVSFYLSLEAMETNHEFVRRVYYFPLPDFSFVNQLDGMVKQAIAAEDLFEAAPLPAPAPEPEPTPEVQPGT